MMIQQRYLLQIIAFIVLAIFSITSQAAAQGSVRIKDLARLASLKDNAIVGYGIVTGLAGTGDSTRNKATHQSIRNMLLRFGVNVPSDSLRSRNSAAVMVTSTLPPYAQSGDKLDVSVTSLGDARSLLGGSLMMTPLALPNREIYAMAQGSLSVGGYSYDLNGNLIQQNHPTAAHIPDGATVNRSVDMAIIGNDGTVEYKLFDPDFETANRIANTINKALGKNTAKAINAARIKVTVPSAYQQHIVSFLTQVEKTQVVPDSRARVVVNERTGTVVSGGNVVISPITVTHGNLNVSISTKFSVSQPFGNDNIILGGEFPSVSTQVVPQTTIAVNEQKPMTLSLPQGANVADLVTALNKVKATSRDTITILQGIKRAGALHAELIIQ